MLISVIICTYNRSGGLLTLLRNLEELDVPPCIEREFLVIDNNSTDATRTVCEPFAQKYSGTYRYIFEGRQGKCFALNTGIRNAKGDILAFTDDDCIPDRRWLAAIAEEFVANPPLAALGGRVELFDDNHKPFTIITRTDRMIITTASQILQNPHIYGCNLAVHRRALSAVEGFDLGLGPATRSLSNEDVDFLYRIYRKKLPIAYSPEVLVYHNHGRTKDSEIEALKYAYTIGRGAVYCKHILDKDVLKLAYWAVSSSLANILKFPFSMKTFKKEMGYLSPLLRGAYFRLLNDFLPGKNV
jgi:glycosyltransferase involved in cell wall biosynthesis